MSQKQNVRIGFVGAGGIARNHLEKLADIPEAQVLGVTDVVRQAAEEAVPEGAEVYDDYRHMLSEADLDAMYVCVPPDAHGDVEVEAARKGVHLFVEKPVNRTIEEARRVEQVITEAGVITAAGYSLRYLPFMEQLRAVLKDHPAYQAVVIRWGGLSPKKWWQTMKSSGGQLVEMVTHQIDMLRGLWGEVETVFASYGYAMHCSEDVDVPSNYSVVLEFEGQKSAVISSACGAEKGRNDTLMLAREAVIEVNYTRGISVNPPDAFPVPEAEPGPLVDEAFVRAVLTGDRNLIRSDYPDAVLSLAVTLACNLSASEGRVVSMTELVG